MIVIRTYIGPSKITGLDYIDWTGGLDRWTDTINNF